MNKNKHTTYQKLWNTMKAILRGTFLSLSAHLENSEKSQANKPNNALENKNKANPKSAEEKKELKSRMKSKN